MFCSISGLYTILANSTSSCCDNQKLRYCQMSGRFPPGGKSLLVKNHRSRPCTLNSYDIAPRPKGMKITSQGMKTSVRWPNSLWVLQRATVYKLIVYLSHQQLTIACKKLEMALWGSSNETVGKCCPRLRVRYEICSFPLFFIYSARMGKNRSHKVFLSWCHVIAPWLLSPLCCGKHPQACLLRVGTSVVFNSFHSPLCITLWCW